MNKNLKYIWLGLVGALLGNAIIFTIYALFSAKYGTLADWMSGVGTVAAILFVYWQIAEQRKEFNESKTARLRIACGEQLHVEEAQDKGLVSDDTDYYIWAVNDGMRVGSFKFLGFCRKDEFNKINTEDIIFNPNNDGLQKLLPHSTNDFELLQPGQVSKEKIISSSMVMKRLSNPKAFYVLYMDAVGKIYKKEVRINYDEKTGRARLF